MPTLISIHCARPGFRRYGIQFATPTTLVEVTDGGQPSKGSPARFAITPAQHNDLRKWSRTPNAPLSVSDPDEATQRVTQLEKELDELREQHARLQHQRAAELEAIEKAKDARAAVEKERAELEQQMATMQAELEQRERAVREIEQRIADGRETLAEIAEETEAATRAQTARAGATDAAARDNKTARGRSKR